MVGHSTHRLRAIPQPRGSTGREAQFKIALLINDCSRAAEAGAVSMRAACVMHSEERGRMAGQTREQVMVVRRRTWFYRLAGQMYAQLVSFDRPVTSSRARMALQHSVGKPLELWGRNKYDVNQPGRK